MKNGEIHRKRGKCCSIVTLDTTFPEINHTSSLVTFAQDERNKVLTTTQKTSTPVVSALRTRDRKPHIRKYTDDDELGITGDACLTKRRRTKPLNRNATRKDVYIGHARFKLDEDNVQHEYMTVLEKEKLARMQRELRHTTELPSYPRRHQSVSYRRLNADPLPPVESGHRSRSYYTTKQSEYRPDILKDQAGTNTVLPPMPKKPTITIRPALVEDEITAKKKFKVRHTKKTAQIKKNMQKVKDKAAAEADILILHAETDRTNDGRVQHWIDEVNSSRPTPECYSPIQSAYQPDTHLAPQLNAYPRVEVRGGYVGTKIPRPVEDVLLNVSKVEKKAYSPLQTSSRIPVPAGRGFSQRSTASSAVSSSTVTCDRSPRITPTSDKSRRMYRAREPTRHISQRSVSNQPDKIPQLKQSKKINKPLTTKKRRNTNEASMQDNHKNAIQSISTTTNRTTTSCRPVSNSTKSSVFSSASHKSSATSRPLSIKAKSFPPVWR